MKKIFFSLMFLTVSIAMAQEEVAAIDVNEDDLGNVNDAFKQSFFDALSEKARENYDRAIEKLLICERIEPNSGAVQLELAKNYMASNAFAKAESHLLKCIELSGEREWTLDNLLEVYNRQQDYEKALQTLQKLVDINPDYEELLPVAFLRVNEKDKALAAIDDLDDRLGLNPQRSALRKQLSPAGVVQATDNISELQSRLQEEPKNEQVYMQVIYAYSQQGNQEKVIETALKWQKQLPNSDQPYLALYKIYLERAQWGDAVSSIQRVLQSAEFENKVKVQVLQDFLNTARVRTMLASQIEPVMQTFEEEVEDVAAFIALGNFYREKKELQRAVQFYEMGLEINDQDFELIKTTALLYLDTGQFDKAKDLSQNALEVFPAQSLLYLINGAALNQLGMHDQAIVILENGLTFLLDEVPLEKDIYSQLVIAFEKSGKSSQAKQAKAKIQQLSN
jgi:tetratricopeptide (TPR) repeat protein